MTFKVTPLGGRAYAVSVDGMESAPLNSAQAISALARWMEGIEASPDAGSEDRADRVSGEDAAQTPGDPFAGYVFVTLLDDPYWNQVGDFVTVDSEPGPWRLRQARFVSAHPHEPSGYESDGFSWAQLPSDAELARIIEQHVESKHLSTFGEIDLGSDRLRKGEGEDDAITQTYKIVPLDWQRPDPVREEPVTDRESLDRFYVQDLDDTNVRDLYRSIADDQVVGLVDEEAGGIVAYLLPAGTDIPKKLAP